MAHAARWDVVAGAVVALVVACGAKVAPETEGDASVVDGGDDAEAVCELVDGSCIGRGCCYMAGGLVDFERRCHGRQTAIYCPPPKHPSSPFFSEAKDIPCGGSPAWSCVVRDLEDGGTEVYYRTYTNELPGFSPCPEELYAEVVQMPSCR
jgi:hypothetical protein